MEKLPAAPKVHTSNKDGSVCKFAFPLLSLEDAQVQNKHQRDGGEVNETEPSKARYKRAVSNASSGLAPSPTVVQSPSAAYVRDNGRTHYGPSLSSEDSPPTWRFPKEGVQGEILPHHVA